MNENDKFGDADSLVKIEIELKPYLPNFVKFHALYKSYIT